MTWGAELGSGDCQPWLCTPEIWGWCNPWFIIHTTVASWSFGGMSDSVLPAWSREDSVSTKSLPDRSRCSDTCVHTHTTLLTPTNKANLLLSTNRTREIVANAIRYWYRDGSKCPVMVKAIFMHSGQGYLCSGWCFMPGAIPDPETGLGKASWSLEVWCTAASSIFMSLLPVFMLSKALIFKVHQEHEFSGLGNGKDRCLSVNPAAWACRP